MSDGDQKESSRESSISFHLLAGLVSGICSAVLLQPADLLKTRLQQSSGNSLFVIFRDVSNSPNAVFRFWRGTTASALRTGFGSAIYFPGLNALRQGVEKSKFLQSSGSKEKGKFNHSSTLPELSNLANLVTGAMARSFAGFVLMPMTVIKVRFESNLYTYKSIFGAGMDILRTEGFKGFFAGIGATTARDAPYAGLYVLFYEQSKKRLSNLTRKISTGETNSLNNNGTKSASVNFASGMVSAGLATALTNPFDAIKTRIQLQPRAYPNVLYAASKMMREEGPKSFLNGLGLRMTRKALSSALAWTLYEEVIRRVASR